MTRYNNLRLLAMGTALLLPSAGFAQAAADDGAALEEIVVTAQRRSENLMKVPLSISASTGAMLQATGIKDLPGVRFNTPGFIAQTGTGYTQIYIRGIGNGVYVGADPSVATFVDDVPRIYGSLVDDLVNVERVEVLKGAQGGLYGRNASGGVVNIISRQPSDTLAAQVRLTGATRGTFQGSGYINVPIGEKVAFNAAVTRNQHKPYRKNRANPTPYTGVDAPFNATLSPGKLNNQDLWSVDGKLRVQLTDDFKITIAGDYTDKHDADGNGWLNTTPQLTYGTYLFLAGLFGVQNPVAPWPSLSLKSNSSYGAYKHKSWTEDYGTSAKMELAMGGVDVTSITAFRWNNSQFQGDIGASPVPIAGFSTNFKRNFFYQELRAVSTGDGPFRWLGGATYFKDKIDASITGITLGFFGAPTTSLTRTRNYSIYGQGAYDLTEQLTLTASLRYANERKKTAFPAAAAGPAVANVAKVDKFIPAATLSYATDGGTVYIRYAKGFKTGGPNPLVRPDRLPVGQREGLILGPETVDTYEAGYRTQLFDRRVQFTSAIFYNKYKGIHVTTNGAGATNADISNALINLGKARTYGAEASASWRVSSPLTLSANIGYLNARYQNANYPGNAFLQPVLAGKNRMILAPKWQGGVQVAYDQPVNDQFRLKANVLASYISHHYFTALEQNTADQPGYAIVNVRLGVATIDDNYSLSLFANNLFDKRFYVFGATSSVGDFQTPGSPRLFGATFEAKF
jgi:iron complex outermembrane recepter protein